jgi:hypothetical protein
VRPETEVKVSRVVVCLCVCLLVCLCVYKRVCAADVRIPGWAAGPAYFLSMIAGLPARVFSRQWCIRRHAALVVLSVYAPLQQSTMMRACSADQCVPICILSSGWALEARKNLLASMDEELRKQMEAKWKASQASETSCTGNGRGAEAVPSADAVSAGQLDVDAIKAKQAADYEAYRREMAERYAKSNASRAAAEPVAEPASEPVAEPPKAPDVPQMQQQRESPPKSPCTAARELREQQDREYQEALAADQAAAGVAPPSSSPAPTYPPAYAAPLPAEAPAADTDREQEIRRAQIAELRARRAQQSAGGSAAAAAAATPGNTEDQVGAPSGAGSGAGIVRDQVTGEMRPSEAQGRVQRLTDDVPGGMGMGMGMGMPPNMSHAGRGAEGGRRPELPAQLQQALSASQLELLYEAMGEMGGGGFQPGMMGGPPAVPGGMPMPDDAMGDFPMGGMAGMGGMGGGGVQPPRRAPPPFGGGYDDGDGMPSNWDPRNARQTEGEQELHRRQVAELRARSRSQARTSGSQEAGGGASSGSGAGDAGAAGSEGSGGMVRDEVTGEMRPAAAQGQVQRLTDDVPGGGAGPGRFGGVFPPFGGPPGGFPGDVDFAICNVMR